LAPSSRFADLKKDGMIIETRCTRVTNTGSPAALHRQLLPADSNAPQAEGPQDKSREPPSSTVDY